MKKLVFALLAVVLLAACEKDPVASSKHPFSKEQQKVVEAFNGEWVSDYGTSGSFSEPDRLVFGWHSDTNVVVYKPSFLYGQEEAFQYQGEVVLKTYRHGVDGLEYMDVPCWYYVSPLAFDLTLYMKADSSVLWDGFSIEFASASQFKIRKYNAYTGSHWETYNKM